MSKRLALALCVALAASFCGYASYAAEGKAAAKKKPMVHHQETGDSGYGAAGCGLGSLIFHDQEGMIQIVSATLNSIYSHQMFAISSGTSNCEGGERRASAKLFIEGNKVALQDDVARGSGETVTALSKLMGCEDSVQFGKTLQRSYGSIYLGASSAIQVRANIFKTISSDPALN